MFVHYFSSTTRAPLAASSVPTNSADETCFQELLPPRIQRMQFIHTCTTHTNTLQSQHVSHTASAGVWSWWCHHPGILGYYTLYHRRELKVSTHITALKRALLLFLYRIFFSEFVFPPFSYWQICLKIIPHRRRVAAIIEITWPSECLLCNKTVFLNTFLFKWHNRFRTMLLK